MSVYVCARVCVSQGMCTILSAYESDRKLIDNLNKLKA